MTEYNFDYDCTYDFPDQVTIQGVEFTGAELEFLCKEREVQKHPKELQEKILSAGHMMTMHVENNYWECDAGYPVSVTHHDYITPEFIAICNEIRSGR